MVIFIFLMFFAGQITGIIKTDYLQLRSHKAILASNHHTSCTRPGDPKKQSSSCKFNHFVWNTLTYDCIHKAPCQLPLQVNKDPQNISIGIALYHWGISGEGTAQSSVRTKQYQGEQLGIGSCWQHMKCRWPRYVENSLGTRVITISSTRGNVWTNASGLDVSRARWGDVPLPR